MNPFSFEYRQWVPQISFISYIGILPPLAGVFCLLSLSHHKTQSVDSIWARSFVSAVAVCKFKQNLLLVTHLMCFVGTQFTVWLEGLRDESKQTKQVKHSKLSEYMGFQNQKKKGWKILYWADITIIIPSLSVGCALLLTVGASGANPPVRLLVC